MINRKQFLEYKLKLSSRLTTDNSGANNNNSTISASERAALITELTEIHNNLEVLMNQYERRFGESYSKMTTTNTSVGGGGGGGGSTTTTSMASASMLNTSGSNVDSSRGIIATAVVGDGMTMNTPIKISSLSSPPGQQQQLQLRHIPSNPSASSLPPQQQQQQQQSSSSIRSGGIPLISVNSSSSPNVRVMHHTR